MRTILTLTYQHLKSWRSNYHVLAAFLLGTAVCLKNSYGYLAFANGIGSSVHIFETYIIIGSRIPFFMGILLGNLMLLSDAPFVSSVSKYEILRTGRIKWFWSQVMYIFFSCILYLLYVLMLTSILTFLYSGSYIQNTWSNAMDMIAVKQTDLVIKKYAFSFAFPELISLTSPFCAAFFTVVFNWLYMVFIGLCILVVNLSCNANYGWVAAAVVHIFGYIAYANGGIVIPLRYSLLCCSAPAYHYISSLKMPTWYSFCLFLVLNIGIVCLGRSFLSRFPFFSNSL